MSTENVNITRPVEIQNDAKSRVAYDLLTLIARQEAQSNPERQSRDYWLTLYSQCLKATSGESLKNVLAKE